MSRLHRLAAVLAAGALVVTTAGTAQAAPADSGAGWLSRQLNKHGLIHNSQFGGFNDYGLTADVGFALKYVGGQADSVRAIRGALAENVDSWTTGVDFGSPGDVYAGSTAKAVVLAQALGADPRAFGGVDLVTRLEGLVGQAAPTVGRIHDQSTSDFANVIGQAYAARGLAVAGSARADDAVAFLLQQQCSAGFFRLNFADPSATDQTCDGGRAAGESPADPDVTSVAVLSLLAVPNQTAAVRASVKDAVAWLKHRQKDNGSFGGGPTTKAANANSTGVAGWALGEAGACGAAARAAGWLTKLQVSGKLAGTPLAGEGGAVAYNRDALDQARTDGIHAAQRDQWRRATSQATPALDNLHTATCLGR